MADGRSSRTSAPLSDVQDSTNGNVSLASVKALVEACVAGLRQSNVVIKDLSQHNASLDLAVKDLVERNASLDLAVKDGLGEMDLRLSAVETKQQIMETSTNNTNTLNESVKFLQNSIIPNWRNEANTRLHDLEETQKMLQKEIGFLKRQLQASEAPLSAADPIPINGHRSPASSRQTSSPDQPMVAAPSTVSRSGPLDEPVITDESDRSAQQHNGHDNILSNGTIHSNGGQDVHNDVSRTSSLPLAETTNRLLSVPPDYHTQALDKCIQDLANLKLPPTSTPIAREGAAISLDKLDLNEPLVKREDFEHKRDWLAAWDAKLKQVQIDANDQIQVLRQEKEALGSAKQAISKVTASIEDIISSVRDICVETNKDRADIAAVRNLHADHEEELEKRLHQLIQREEQLDQDEYFLSTRGKPLSDLQAQDYRRKQKMSAFAKELRERIDAVLELEQQLMARGPPPGGITQYLPDVPEIPRFD